jgi:hypothetical protein
VVVDNRTIQGIPLIFQFPVCLPPKKSE